MPASSSDRIRWGILGTGGIAATFVRDLQLLDDALPVAVGSRQAPTARAFADRFDIARAYGSYQELVADPDVDVVYIATPQTMHAANMLLAAGAGKPALCEKPFTVDADEAREVVRAARERGVFLMEAMWTRFLPHMRRIDQLLRSGALGEVVTVTADHGQRIPSDPAHRLRRPELAGGALLDLGVYPVSLASHVLGRPDKIVANGALLPNGLDAQTSMVFSYRSGATAVLTTTIEARTANRAVISGTEARIEIDPVWYTPTSFTLIRTVGASAPERFEHTRDGHGLRHQAAAVGQLLREGATESPVMPLDESVTIMETLDEVRRQLGVVYSRETARTENVSPFAGTPDASPPSRS